MGSSQFARHKYGQRDGGNDSPLGSQMVAEPLEFAATTPRDGSATGRLEVVTPPPLPRKRKPYDHSRFLAAIATACQQFAREVMAKEAAEESKQDARQAGIEAIKAQILRDL